MTRGGKRELALAWKYNNNLKSGEYDCVCNCVWPHANQKSVSLVWLETVSKPALTIETFQSLSSFVALLRLRFLLLCAAPSSNDAPCAR